MKLKFILLPIVFAGMVSGCSNSEIPRVSATEVSEVAISDIPQSVRELVNAARPDFTATEVLKKLRDGRVYYDVEGEIPGGEEIEFDVLMTETGPEIVEIQRDIDWDAVPRLAQVEVNKGNSEKLEVTRVIESTQTDKSIIYEVFVEGHPADPRFEVRVKDNVATLLSTRWKH